MILATEHHGADNLVVGTQRHWPAAKATQIGTQAAPLGCQASIAAIPNTCDHVRTPSEPEGVLDCRSAAQIPTGSIMSNLSEAQFVEKLRGTPGRYVFHEMGTYTLREADGSVILKVPKQFVDDLTHAGKLVQYVDRDPRKLFPIPAFG